MKKLLVISMALMALFAFSPMAVASVNPQSDSALCLNCGEGSGKSACPCVIDNVPCPVQGTCAPFDYEGTHAEPAWCADAVSACCRAIFYICECGDTPNTTFAEDTTIGIRMTILVDGYNGRDQGAYWAEDVSGQIDLGTFETKAAACLGDEDKGFVNNNFYTNSTETVQVLNTSIQDNTTCYVPLASRATVIRSATAGDGFMVTAVEANPAAPLNYWLINIPQLRIDPSLITPGALISVKIELLDSLGSGICPTCAPICECIYDIAYACCEEAAATDCIYYPYVLQQEEGWMSGIAVTNMNFVAGTTWDAVLTFTDKDGAVWTYTATFDEGTVQFNMDTLVGLAGWTPAAGPGWLQIAATGAALDGYQYNMLVSDTAVFGAGVLSRDCDGTR